MSETLNHQGLQLNPFAIERAVLSKLLILEEQRHAAALDALEIRRLENEAACPHDYVRDGHCFVCGAILDNQNTCTHSEVEIDPSGGYRWCRICGRAF